MENKRSSGILCHVTSLPSRYGIGGLGKEAYDFIDFLHSSGQHLWQMLPIGPVGYGNSPYQSPSAFAGNPLFIDPDLLVAKGWLDQAELDHLAPVESTDTVKFDEAERIKTKKILPAAVKTFIAHATKVDKEAFESFIEKNSYWLEDYALFMTCKKQYSLESWNEWPEGIRKRNKKVLEEVKTALNEEFLFHELTQFFFYEQWKALKSYAQQKEVQLVGDIPIYVAFDSADVWSHQNLFYLNEKGTPVEVAGVPPDYFSETGQLWGNPLYKWEVHKKQKFKWWIDRIRINLNLFDFMRLDHFRGLEAYWSVPFGEETAINGKWIQAPGRELLNAIRKEMKEVPIIAEDLGIITDGVVELRDEFDLPGMKILQFAFDSNEDNEYLPHTYDKNFVVYTGTHDNDTVIGWYSQASDNDRKYMDEYLSSSEEKINWKLIRSAHSSVADYSIIPLQDILGLDNKGRMNTPGTIEGNWLWRMLPGALEEFHREKLHSITKLYNR